MPKSITNSASLYRIEGINYKHYTSEINIIWELLIL